MPKTVELRNYEDKAIKSIATVKQQLPIAYFW